MKKYSEVYIGQDFADLNKTIQIAIANIPVFEKNIEASFRGKPNIHGARFKKLAALLNELSCYRTDTGEKIDLVVFPEVSIPYEWESLLVHWSRSQKIGVVCGLEHQIKNNNEAHNEMIAILPFRTTKERWSCYPLHRIKKYYSPEEKFLLINNNLHLPSQLAEPYHLIHWRGASFAIFNCYELTSIEDRSLFVGKVDFIVASEFNKDINYFSNIVESASRDIHCYVVQVNGSQYGDSRVVSPSKTEKMNPIRIKGGDNLTFLTMKLNLESLREYQRLGYGLQKGRGDYKPTPPGLKLEDVDLRISLATKQ